MQQTHPMERYSAVKGNEASIDACYHAKNSEESKLSDGVHAQSLLAV